ncbi:MAG: hypothetical protein V1734_01375 [Nanoarchaeota archaeon]
MNMKTLFVLLALLIAIVPSVFAADPVTDKVSAITHYAEQYEMGEISYAELKIYSNSLREDIKGLMSEVVFEENEGKHYEGISPEAAEKFFGKPTDYTNWVWVLNEEHDMKVEKKMPRWEKAVYDGKKIQITFNAWPQIYMAEDGEKEIYWVDFKTRFKKQFNLDISGMEAELKGLAEQYLSAQSNGAAFAGKLVEFSTKVQSYIEQNRENCQLMLEKFFSSDDKSEEQTKLVWESEIYSGEQFMLFARTTLCESCEWVWADTWFEPRMEGPGFKMPDFSKEGSSSYDFESLKDKDDAELLSMLKQEIEKARQAAEAFDNGRGSLDIGGISSNVQMLHKAMSEKANWNEKTRQESKQKYISNLDSLLSVFKTEKSQVKELRYEKRIVENFVEQKDKHCRQVQEEECAIDEGCINGECRIAIGGNEDCQNNADDDGDTLIDCRDPDCAKSCGKFCKSVCEDECWPCFMQCDSICKECSDCRNNGGKEECNEICSKECDPCRNEKCWDTSKCTECRTCEEANREVQADNCDMDCVPCKACTESGEDVSCEEECKQCAVCKSPSMNPKCVDKCREITQGFMSTFEACEDMCKKGVIFYCSGSKQYSPCDDMTYICNGNMQPIPCEFYTCINEDGTERIQTVGCDQQAFCGENQVADGERCRCRAGFFDCDKDGVNCESETPCSGAQEMCSDQKDNDDDYLIDCDDRMDCKEGMLCGLGKVCFDGACMLQEEANVSAKCPEGMEYKDGKCKCMAGYAQWEDKCVAAVIDVTCKEGYALIDGKCAPVMSVPEECPEGFEFIEEGCARKEIIPGENVTECGEGYEFKEGKCLAIITECPQGYELKEGECIAVEAEGCPDGYGLKENECIFVGEIIQCAENEILDSGKCVSKDVFEDSEVRPEETGMQCVLAEDCGSERAVCSNGYCKEIPEEIYEREYGEGVPEEVIIPEDTGVEEGEEEKEELIVQPGEEQEGGMVEIPEEKEEPAVQEQPKPQQESAPEGITGAFFSWITGFAIKEDEKCSSDDECNANQKCDKYMGRCHCDGGWFDCNGMRDGQDSDGCESEDPTCGGKREMCPGGCNDNQFCNEEKGWCDCNEGFNDCDGNWMNGCESETRCDQCTSDGECSAPVCAEWDNVLIKFACVEGEGWPKENGIVSFTGGCEFHPTGKVNTYLHFDAWGEGMQEIQDLRRGLEGGMQGEWCRFELESAMKERKELEKGMDTEFLKWFFDEYLVAEPDKWQNRISGIHDTYWSLVENARETARTSLCLGEQFPANSPIDIEYESDFGKVHIREEWTTADEFEGMNVLSPYMEIWVFPSKDIVRQEIVKAGELGYMPGPPEDRVKEIGPSASEKEDIKRNPETLKEIEDIANKFGGSLEGLLTIKDGDENLFYIKAVMNPDVIFKAGPVKAVDFEPDVTVDIQLDFLYDFIKSSEQHGEVQSPPWDKSKRVSKAIGNAVDAGVMAAKVTGAIATGNIKVKPLSAVPTVLKVMNMAGEGGQESPEGMAEEK